MSRPGVAARAPRGRLVAAGVSPAVESEERFLSPTACEMQAATFPAGVRLRRHGPFAVLVLLLVANAALAAPPDVRRSPQTDAALAYEFTPAETKLLEEIEHAAFLYFWNEVGHPAELAKDRQKAPVSSIAAVGFQLSSLPIGVEHGWITREQGARRAERVLRALVERSDNKRWGVYLHFPDMNNGGPSHEGFEVLASTVDHALLMAGAIPAGVYFGPPVSSLVDRLIAETNWRKFAVTPEGFLSMGFKPDDPDKIDGPGKLLEWRWYNASDEERLVYFLAVGAPRAEYAVAPEVYYRLQRTVKGYKDNPPYAVSWPGSLFTYFFSHCWIDYRHLAADDPSTWGVDGPRIDWFENSRRAVLTHRLRCIEQAAKFKTLAADRWGLSACVGKQGYIVPQVQPNLSGRDEWFEGTVAPYAAGSSIMFAPAESIAVLTAVRALRDKQGAPLVWRDRQQGGYGFVDAFNLDQNFVADDYVGIDQGPLLLGIENARTGLIWKLFMQHPAAKRAVSRLKLKRR